MTNKALPHILASLGATVAGVIVAGLVQLLFAASHASLTWPEAGGTFLFGVISCLSLLYTAKPGSAASQQARTAAVLQSVLSGLGMLLPSAIQPLAAPNLTPAQNALIDQTISGILTTVVGMANTHLATVAVTPVGPILTVPPTRSIASLAPLAPGG